LDSAGAGTAQSLVADHGDGAGKPFRPQAGDGLDARLARTDMTMVCDMTIRR